MFSFWPKLFVSSQNFLDPNRFVLIENTQFGLEWSTYVWENSCFVRWPYQVDNINTRHPISTSRIVQNVVLLSSKIKSFYNLWVFLPTQKWEIMFKCMALTNKSSSIFIILKNLSGQQFCGNASNTIRGSNNNNKKISSPG